MIVVTSRTWRTSSWRWVGTLPRENRSRAPVAPVFIEFDDRNGGSYQVGQVQGRLTPLRPTGNDDL